MMGASAPSRCEGRDEQKVPAIGELFCFVLFALYFFEVLYFFEFC